MFVINLDLSFASDYDIAHSLGVSRRFDVTTAAGLAGMAYFFAPEGHAGLMKNVFVWTATLLASVCLVGRVVAVDIDDVRALMQQAPMRNMGSPYRGIIDRYVEEKIKATGLE